MESSDKELLSAKQKYFKQITAIIGECERLSKKYERKNIMESARKHFTATAEIYRKLLNEEFDSDKEFMAAYKAIKKVNIAFCKNLTSQALARNESIRNNPIS